MLKLLWFLTPIESGLLVKLHERLRLGLRLGLIDIEILSLGRHLLIAILELIERQLWPWESRHSSSKTLSIPIETLLESRSEK